MRRPPALPPELRRESRDAQSRSRRVLVVAGCVIQPVVDIARRLVAGNAIAFLHFADELIFSSVELIDLVVGQLAPLFLDAAFELGPLAFENVVVHVRLPCDWRTLRYGFGTTVNWLSMR